MVTGMPSMTEVQSYGAQSKWCRAAVGAQQAVRIVQSVASA